MNFGFICFSLLVFSHFLCSTFCLGVSFVDFSLLHVIFIVHILHILHLGLLVFVRSFRFIFGQLDRGRRWDEYGRKCNGCLSWIFFCQLLRLCFSAQQKAPREQVPSSVFLTLVQFGESVECLVGVYCILQCWLSMRYYMNVVKIK